MTSFVDQCHQIFDIDENKTIVEIYYSKYKEGTGYENLVDTFGTVTTCDFNYNDKSLVRYERFLDTMVIKTLETIHKMVLIQLDNVLFENKNINSQVTMLSKNHLGNNVNLIVLVQQFCLFYYIVNFF